MMVGMARMVRLLAVALLTVSAALAQIAHAQEAATKPRNRTEVWRLQAHLQR